jgi:hypothetical protein
MGLTLLSCLLALPVPSGCAAAIPLIHEVATVVADITGALDQIEVAVQARPNADPAVVNLVTDAVAKAKTALAVVQAAARAGADVASKDYVAAVTSLLDAYDAATEAAKAFGVLQAPAAQRARLGTSGPGHTLVPTTAELRAELSR